MATGTREYAPAIDTCDVQWEIHVYRIMSWLILAAAAMVLAISPWIGTDLAFPEIVLCAVAICHFMVVSRILTWGQGRWLTRVRWLSVTAEASFGTLALAICAVVKGPEWAATSPTVLIYAVALVCTSIRISPVLTVYCTLMACAQYLVLSLFFLQPAMDQGHVATSMTWASVERCFWLLLIGLSATFVTMQVRRTALAGRSHALNRDWIVREMSKFLPEDAQAAALSGRARAGAVDRRNVTVLFCDLRDFTGLCERENPDDVIALLNEFFARACKIVRTEGGQVNKFLGDGLLALFDDAHLPDHPDAAVRTARRMVDMAAELRQRGGIWEHLSIGVGLDSGPVLVGTVGADDRLELTAIGSAVNRAARLQAVARFAPRRIVISESCAELLQDTNTRSLGAVEVKGFDGPVGIFTTTDGGRGADFMRRISTVSTVATNTPT